MEDILINLGITTVLAAIKNPGKKATFKKAFLKVFSAIKAAFPGDPDFNG